ncbi:MAG: 2,3-bisphosphoglycerate-independent phosphoglycerate mutase [Patescibacteria group bacterium]|nr:2,3-bisphosphoglycerate-independent phosphoglycerate mutase [Patescibacteria group bacterium]
MKSKETKIRPAVLIVLDGWGIAKAGPGNAITLAKTPNFDKFWSTYPHTQLLASGESVGLPKGESGNSEVGHLNIGAGRIVYQDLPRINMAIADGTFINNQAFVSACRIVKDNKSSLHLMGLASPGGVHSSLEHLYSLLWLAKERGVEKVYIHMFTDGRDTPPTSALIYLAELEEKIKHIGVGKIATVSGRYYAMDRDKRWARTKKAYDAIVNNEGPTASSAYEAIERAYQTGQTDEFIVPIVILENQKPIAHLSSEDAVIFFNFRPDRARQLTQAIVLPSFNEFERGTFLKRVFFVSMAEYEKGLPTVIAFPPEGVDVPLARILHQENLRQLHIAETEKYVHVTYFINGGREDPFSGEDRILIPSPKVATYDEKPEMSAYEITDVVTQRLEKNLYDFIVINFANADMVGHTGIIPCGIKAIETIDDCLGKVVNATLSAGGAVVITADHGNAEEMVNLQTGEVDTEHSANPVPLLIISKELEGVSNKQLNQGILADVAPTILDLMGVSKPEPMTGRSLLEQIKF